MSFPFHSVVPCKTERFEHVEGKLTLVLALVLVVSSGKCSKRPDHCAAHHHEARTRHWRPGQFEAENPSPGEIKPFPSTRISTSCSPPWRREQPRCVPGAHGSVLN